MELTAEKKREQDEMAEWAHAESQRAQEIWDRYGEPLSWILGVLLIVMIIGSVVLGIMGKIH